MADDDVWDDSPSTGDHDLVIMQMNAARRRAEISSRARYEARDAIASRVPTLSEVLFSNETTRNFLDGILSGVELGKQEVTA